MTKEKKSAAPSLWDRWRRTQHRIRNRAAVVEIAAGKAIRWTAPALSREAEALADLAPLSACRPGDRVAFRLPNGIAWIVFFLALQRRGIAAIPLDPTLPDTGARELVRSLGARFLFLDGAFETSCTGAKAVRSPGVACIKLTSGSTGLPKPILCRPAHLVADGRQVAATMGLRAADRNLAVVPFGHSYGLGNLILPLILKGIPVVCAAAYVPRQVLEWIARHRVTVLPSVPAFFRLLAAMPRGGDLPKMPTLRLAISAGASLPPETAAVFLERYGVRVHNFYGSSETGGICYDRSGAASLSGRAAGRPLRGVAVTVSRGRLTVAGPAVAVGRRYRMPDLAERNARGEIVLLGRSGPGANIGGKKVHPSEVERELRALPGVTDAAVWTSREKGRDYLAAAVETVLGQAEIERRLGARLPAWKLPKRWTLAAALPRNARGKLDAARLRGAA